MGTNAILALLLMTDDSDNENLMFVMMINQVLPVQPVQTVYPTWKVNGDGVKNLVPET